MKYLTDISNFNEANDFLPIFNGCLNADLTILFALTHKLFKSPSLDGWYKNFSLSAIIADVMILMIGVILTRFVYPYVFSEYSLILFTILAVCIQITHDFLFYWLFVSTPKGYSRMLDYFKLYADKVGGLAIIGNSIAVIMSCLLSSHFAGYSLNANLIILVTTLYFIPYLLFM